MKKPNVKQNIKADIVTNISIRTALLIGVTLQISHIPVKANIHVGPNIDKME